MQLLQNLVSNNTIGYKGAMIKNFIQEYNLFDKKLILKFTCNKNVLSLWMEYEENIVYSTLVLNAIIGNKNTHFTVYYKEPVYANNKNFNNKRDGGKTEKEVLISRTIDRSLRPFLALINDQEITLNVMLLQNISKRDDNLIKLVLWASSLLVHYGTDGTLLHNIYGGRLFLKEGGYCTTIINDDGLVMMEGALQRTSVEEIKLSMDKLLEEHKLFKELYTLIPTLNLLKKKDKVEEKKKSAKYVRPNGRKYTEIRPLNIIMNPLKANSVIFTRGETSVLGVLSTAANEVNEISVNYRFHPFSVGEGGETFGNSRREKGHGDFVKNSLWPLWRCGFSYKMIGEVLSCSGSSSQATLCATSLCLANEFGEELVSGITVGEINGDILLDLSGEEDQLSNCDCKMASDSNGLIYGLLMDTKRTIKLNTFWKLLNRGMRGNREIIKYMASHIGGHRELIPVKTSKLGSIVGKNGNNMKEIQKLLHCTIKIFDQGFVLLKGEHKKEFTVAKEIINSFNTIENGEKITAIIYAIKVVDDNTLNVNLGLFHFNVNKKLFQKYQVGEVIRGIININDKIISLDKIKKHNI